MREDGEAFSRAVRTAHPVDPRRLADLRSRAVMASAPTEKPVGAATLAALTTIMVLVLGGLVIMRTGPKAESSPGGPQRAQVAQPAPPLSPELSAQLDREFRRSPYTREIMARGLGQKVALAQTIEGFTVTVARTYADPKYMFFGFVVTGPKERVFEDIKIIDWSDNATARSGILKILDEPRAELQAYPSSANTLDGRERGYFVGFETPELDAGTRQLRVRLEIPAITAREVTTGQPLSALSAAYPDTCDEHSEPVRCYVVRGPFTFDLTVSIEPVTPRSFDPKLEQALAATAVDFLDQRLFQMAAKDSTLAQGYEDRARALLTPAYSTEVRDIAALDIPNVRTKDDGRAALAKGPRESEYVTATRAAMPFRWQLGGKIVIRRFHFEYIDGRWRISGIESLENDPQPWLTDPDTAVR